MRLVSKEHSPVDLAQKKGEPGNNSKKANFGMVRKQIFHRITYLKSCLGKLFMPNLILVHLAFSKSLKMQYAQKICS